MGTDVNSRWPESFWDRVDKRGPRECWPWLGPLDDGYGRVRFPGIGNMRCQRAAYILARGEIPHGLDVDHICVNPPCCNPDHLQAVTSVDNVRLGQMRRGRTPGASVHRRRRKDGTLSWQVKWREGGRQQSQTFRREVEARQHARLIYARKLGLVA